MAVDCSISPHGSARALFAVTRPSCCLIHRKSVRRPTGTVTTGSVPGQIRVTMRGQVQQPNVRRPAIARRNERKRASVRRKSRLIIVTWPVGQLFNTRTIRMHPINVGRAASLGCKHDPFSIGGKGWVVIKPAGREQRSFILAVVVQRARNKPILVGPNRLNTRRGLPLSRTDQRCSAD